VRKKEKKKDCTKAPAEQGHHGAQSPVIWGEDKQCRVRTRVVRKKSKGKSRSPANLPPPPERKSKDQKGCARKKCWGTNVVQKGPMLRGRKEKSENGEDSTLCAYLGSDRQTEWEAKLFSPIQKKGGGLPSSTKREMGIRSRIGNTQFYECSALRLVPSFCKTANCLPDINFGKGYEDDINYFPNVAPNFLSMPGHKRGSKTLAGARA